MTCGDMACQRAPVPRSLCQRWRRATPAADSPRISRDGHQTRSGLGRDRLGDTDRSSLAPPEVWEREETQTAHAQSPWGHS
ncbi:hypothetical protein AAFF_G00042840 [Aldrovandia affinis]|uniref:Uncharacterized protein n=1 Tax=Aldrovandia affinis TaxID=143900 RepID=A0AAD7S2C5_9TELE|nr:hypothetical protein AAFF_G00042840 [Aldrovandia affinis]